MFEKNEKHWNYKGGISKNKKTYNKKYRETHKEYFKQKHKEYYQKHKQRRKLRSPPS